VTTTKTCNNEKMSVGIWLLRALQGALVGGGAILPGISGGVLCVTFGIYQPMMALLAHPVRSFRIYYKLFIPFLIGWLAGFLALARVVVLLFEASSGLAVCLFVGLIAGTLPSLFKDAAKQGTGAVSWSAFAICMVVIYAFLSFLQAGEAAAMETNEWSFFFCGAVWGLSLIIPGLSSSSVLIFLGLYQPMTVGIARLQMSVILPLLLGIVLTVAVLARLVNRLFERHNSIASHAVLGIVIASTLLIIPAQFQDALGLALSVVAFALGFGGALLMNKCGDTLGGQ